MKKFLSVTLSLVMTLSLLAGCSGGEKPQETQQQTQAAQTEAPSSETTKAPEAGGQEQTEGSATQFPREESLYFFSGMGVLPVSFNPLVGAGGEWPAGQMQYLLYEALFMMDMLTGESDSSCAKGT